MSEIPLDRPVWNALTGPLARFAVAQGGARRFLPEIGPLSAVGRDDMGDLADLAAFVPPGGALYTMQATEHPAPPGIAIERRAALQMVADAGTVVAVPDATLLPLGDDDAPEMLALATLTEPGPFATRTHELGQFWGVRREGKLVAMAGERMRVPGFCEVSAVCTHPDHRGRGYAGALMLRVMRQIRDRGEIPFLTSYAHNHGAIALYEKLGFRVRRDMIISVLTRAKA